MYAIELNERIQSFDCPDCGRDCLTVWGFVYESGAAYGVYYAGLMTGHEQPSARLTISIGGWGVDGADEKNVKARHWLFIEARPTNDSYEMMVQEPDESFYFGKDILGIPMSRASALASPALSSFFEVADFIAFNDPA